MISRSEFDGLEARVSRIEGVLRISNTVPPPPPQHIPYTLVIEQEKFTSSDIEHLNTSSFYKHLENDYHVFIRIYIHGQTVLTPKTNTRVVQGFYEYTFIQSFYNVLIIKHTDLGTVGEHVWPKMNTMKTVNIHQYIDRYKHFSLFFGYSNANEALKEGDNLFFQGGDKGVFFIINDHTNHNVQTYVKNHSSQYDLFTTGTEGIGSGEIDVYKSKSLTKDEVVLKVLIPPGSTQTPSTTAETSTAKELNKKFVTKQD